MNKFRKASKSEKVVKHYDQHFAKQLFEIKKTHVEKQKKKKIGHIEISSDIYSILFIKCMCFV